MVMITPYFIKTKGYDVIGVNMFLRKYAKIFMTRKPRMLLVRWLQDLRYMQFRSPRREITWERSFVDDAFVSRSHKSGKKWKITLYSHSKPKTKIVKIKWVWNKDFWLKICVYKGYWIRPFPSCSTPQLRSEAICETIDTKMCFMLSQKKPIFSRKVFSLGLQLCTVCVQRISNRYQDHCFPVQGRI